MKNETIEEAGERAVKSGLFKDETLFIAGAKWQQERSYSKEEVNSIFYAICKHSFFQDNVETVYIQDVKDEFIQLKKK